ncbi:hypothetical protein FJV41_41050 [Myxococcus llanfairpwllgwyngyllgogerychwyrndrobwllllantysiliogogogochensis]|uniref:Uncharacterized protein n=1 Tax=Myxococcus llanfairpwllgwyngyllgogerychwyrndrobwllllantysiliogogogochensis TaxID=2590453 RepID=A0A540WMQ7_9BACT|nr:hypothetical protein [Myxococcus llanfairpwllgwyngyllgogerychwyrndrobwllllantysiliogogogochensis]TQF10127.1 hypothetical protein FJV41_41050 [Myxococcus llanfairpwllgwyngyllgogerychwyrndrobwllllantysiliogogogochensis]
MTTAAPSNIPAPPPGCPFNAEFMPPNLRKHVDPAAPVPLRMMAAKSLVPLSPSDMLGALFMLTFDPDEAVREMAAKTSAGLPDRILGSALRDEEVQPQVLGFFLGLLKEKAAYAEMLILNASTPDDAVAVVARDCGAKLAEIIGQNQLRLLRHEDILRGLCSNAQAQVSLIDSVCDFAVRSGLVLADVPQMKAARVRLFGPEAAEAPPDPGPTADQLLQEMGGEVADENAAPLEEGKRLTLAQRLMKMSIAEKIKLATLGNKEARTALIRETNKLVAVAVVRSPRITDGEVLSFAANRAMMDDVLRVIYNNREWTKNMKVRLALVKNPKVPLTVTMKFLNSLRDNEIKDLSRDKNVPAAVQAFAKKLLEKKTTPKKTEDK